MTAAILLGLLVACGVVLFLLLRARDEDIVELPTIRAPLDVAALDAPYEEDFNRNREAAIKAVEKPDTEFRVWRQPDGWWVVGRWIIVTQPSYFGQYDQYRFFRAAMGRWEAPETKCRAFGYHSPMPQQFLYKKDALAWLASLIADPNPETVDVSNPNRPQIEKPKRASSKRKPA